MGHTRAASNTTWGSHQRARKWVSGFMGTGEEGLKFAKVLWKVEIIVQDVLLLIKVTPIFCLKFFPRFLSVPLTLDCSKGCVATWSKHSYLHVPVGWPE